MLRTYGLVEDADDGWARGQRGCKRTAAASGIPIFCDASEAIVRGGLERAMAATGHETGVERGEEILWFVAKFGRNRSLQIICAPRR